VFSEDNGCESCKKQRKKNGILKGDRKNVYFWNFVLETVFWSCDNFMTCGGTSKQFYSASSRTLGAQNLKKGGKTSVWEFVWSSFHAHITLVMFRYDAAPAWLWECGCCPMADTKKCWLDTVGWSQVGALVNDVSGWHLTSAKFPKTCAYFRRWLQKFWESLPIWSIFVWNDSVADLVGKKLGKDFRLEDTVAPWTNRWSFCFRIWLHCCFF
jgi:ssDNA-binding Zn-finger/Zn-ribbon topoisomerase 1